MTTPALTPLLSVASPSGHHHLAESCLCAQLAQPHTACLHWLFAACALAPGPHLHYKLLLLLLPCGA